MASEQERLEAEVDAALDAALHAAQQDQALRSRVQAVELRRRPSDDTDGAESHRSSLVSHHSLASAQSAPASDWLQRARKATSACLQQPIGAFREHFDEDRSSLPTLEGQAQDADVTPLAGSGSRRGAWRTKDKNKNKQPKTKCKSKSARVFEGPDAPFDVYYAPQSPAPSTVHSAPRARVTSGVSLVSERKGAVLTEVEEPNFALQVFQTEQVRSKRQGLARQGDGCGDYDDDDVERGKTPLDAMHFFVSGAPHVSIDESQKYTFAIVLKHTEQIFHLLKRRFPSRSAASIRRDLPQQVSALQQKCVRRLIQAGLGVVLLDNALYDNYLEDQRGVRSKRDPSSAEEDVARNLCILIDPKKNPDLLLHEFKRELDELSIKRGDALGRLAEESLDSLKEMCFSPALELQLTHNIIQNAFKDYDKEEWVIDVNKELTVNDMIVECFPLHDRAFNRKFFDEYRKRTFDLNLRKAAAGNSDRWAVEELRLHFGERVAFLFAF
ncbi:hypothetical protein PF001_g25900, partial [Phytophthora fragariae]